MRAKGADRDCEEELGLMTQIVDKLTVDSTSAYSMIATRNG